MWGLIIGLLIAIVIAAFASFNSTPVALNLIFWKMADVPLSLVVLFAVLLGVLMSALLGIPGYFKNRQLRKELERKIKAQESKIETLEHIPAVKQAEEIKHEEEKKSEDPPKN
jgi:uncharacterized integral membrane protein